jgi:hypothetical protein
MGQPSGWPLFFVLNLDKTIAKAELIEKVGSTIKLTKKETEVIVGIIF